MLSNHDMCSLAGIGGAFDGRGEYISFIKRSNKIDLYIRHATDNALDFIATCVDFSDKSASQTFSVTTSVSGYLR
ncbi:MAG: hypothetical protein LBG59_09825 [Candidatus Peribacteria bacterium]|jgi:hypothetical protein|nr:hypothetical protein [Candidatus Peribacteria bacterium]